jgi:hypothetical protein
MENKDYAQLTDPERIARDAEANWAKKKASMNVGEVPSGAINLNVHGRRALSPLQGFGQMWQKTYSIEVKTGEYDPKQMMTVWKQRFPDFWPDGNHFYGSLKGIEPGDVAVLNISAPGGMKLSTGIEVMYADEESFTFMTPEGHMFAGWITFSAFEVEDGVNKLQIQALIRANDPLYELSFRLGIGHKAEDKFWQQTLVNLASFFGDAETEPKLEAVRVDPRMQWKEAKNIWWNAGIRSGIYMALTPMRLLGFGKK